MKCSGILKIRWQKHFVDLSINKGLKSFCECNDDNSGKTYILKWNIFCLYLKCIKPSLCLTFCSFRYLCYGQMQRIPFKSPNLTQNIDIYKLWYWLTTIFWGQFTTVSTALDVSIIISYSVIIPPRAASCLANFQL